MISKIMGTLLVFIIFTCPAMGNAEDLFKDPTTGMEFVYVKGGCFDMGDSVGEGDPNERPVHEVCLSDFYLGKFEVTNAQYKKFRSMHTSGKQGDKNLDKDNLPVVNVSWEDANGFAKWLSEKSGETYRLPSEAQWEYATRAGSRQSRFWGNNPDEACNYANVADLTAKKERPSWTSFHCDDGYLAASPVGSFQPNDFGLYDTLGNVWEWCRDVYNSEAYSKLPKQDPVYAGQGEYRVMRGGGWSNGPLGIRNSHRVGLSPNFGHHSLGFRLVKTTE